MIEPSAGERSFLYYWRILDGPTLKREHFFHPTRRWRFDFVHLPSLVAIEIDGGTWVGGRHTTGTGFENDCHKLNAATGMGWRVFRFTPQMMKKDPDCLHPAIDAMASSERGIQHWGELRGGGLALEWIDYPDGMTQTLPKKVSRAYDKWIQLCDGFMLPHTTTLNQMQLSLKERAEHEAKKA